MRRWRWLLAIYALGVLADAAWHAAAYLAEGDRVIANHEWVIGIQASLFWPLDFIAQMILALR
ncbi:MAG: hypothetical protein JO010_07025 [Alphaproteobacteria bacterium]|nr:hypothetical protein [Alphaproteobacteria bacterium]